MDGSRYPFFPAYPLSIRRETEPASAFQQVNGCDSKAVEVGNKSRDVSDKFNGYSHQLLDPNFPELVHHSKRARIVSQTDVDAHGIYQPGSNESNACFAHSTQTDDGNGDDSDERFEYSGGTDDLASESESTDARNPVYGRSEDIENLLSDKTVFRYCLEGTDERYTLLKEIGLYAAEQDIQKFAEQVDLYSGCSHHGYQIMMSKQLVQEGISSWHAIANGNPYTHWVDSLPEIIRRFRKISRSSRALTGQDIEVLRQIAGCGDEMNCENFNKLWSWLYPIARTIAMEQINDMWESTLPKWIEGLITKEEAENALKLSEPGAFVLRFPTSRSWPHPDAGSLVVTFVGADLIIHNKLLNLDTRDTKARPLTDLLLEEPELTKLTRVPRFL